MNNLTMKNIILFDPEEARADLLPLTFTRPVALIRHGITTIAEKWQRAIPGTYSYATQDFSSPAIYTLTVNSWKPFFPLNVAKP